MALLAIRLFLSLISPVFSSYQPQKLIVFAGIPSSLDEWKPSEISWDACLSMCWYDLDCRVSNLGSQLNTSTCYVMKRGNITIKPSKDKVYRVAVKISNASTECLSKSSDFFNQPFTETRNESRIIRSEFSYSNGQYRVVYTVSICPSNTTLYTRKVAEKTYHVCVGFRLFRGKKGNFYDAQKLCNSSGGYGLTGPLKGIDYDILKEKGIALRKQNGLNANDFFWIDGISPLVKYDFVFEDESHNGLKGYIMHPQDPNDNPPSALYWYGASGGYQTADYGADYSAGIGAICRVNDVPLQD